MKSTATVVFASALALVGCVGSDDGVEGVGENAAPVAVDQAAPQATQSNIQQVFVEQDRDDSHRQPPPPIASIALENGNVVEFYDFGSGVLMSETGKAYSPPATEGIPREKRRNVIDIWEHLAPNQPVPASLVAARTSSERIAPSSSELTVAAPGVQPIQSGPSTNPIPTASTKSHAGSTDGAEFEGQGDSPGSCGNGCCDATWLHNSFYACNSGEWNWFLFDYGWSWADTGSDVYLGYFMACAATGWSYYQIHIYNEGWWDWWVPQQTYRTFQWIADMYFCIPEITCYDDQRITAAVNINQQHNRHTQCGAVYWW